MKPILTEAAAVESIRDFFRTKPLLVFGTGMSCCVDPRYGMGALTDELVGGMGALALTAEQKVQWGEVENSLRAGVDLESSLSEVTDRDLIRKITALTGGHLAALDREYSYRLAAGRSEWPAGRFIKRLVDTLPEGDPILHALTPNYDLLFELWSGLNGVEYTSGFVGGVHRRTDWKAAEQSMLTSSKVVRSTRLRRKFTHKKHVRLYKVHGSLNYFFYHDSVIENNAWMWNPPDDVERVIITPGVSKYETIQRYRMELLSMADDAIEKSNSFLFLGYGFNDRHIEEYIRRKMETQKCHGLVITRDCNPRIKSLLSRCPNLWLVHKDGSSTVGTVVLNDSYSTQLELSSTSLWEIGTFTDRFFGG